MSWPSSSTDQPGDGRQGHLPGRATGPPPGPAVDPHPVDQIAIRKMNGYNFLTPLQWSHLDRDTRARSITNDQVVFLYQGEEVPVRAALLWFRTAGNGDGTH